MKYTALTRFGAITLMFFHSLFGEPIAPATENEDARNIFNLTARGIETTTIKKKDGTTEIKFQGKLNVKPFDLPVRIAENNAIILVLSKNGVVVITFPATYSATTAKDKGSSLLFEKGRGRFVEFHGSYLLGKDAKGKYELDIQSIAWVTHSKKRDFKPAKGSFGLKIPLLID